MLASKAKSSRHKIKGPKIFSDPFDKYSEILQSLIISSVSFFQ